MSRSLDTPIDIDLAGSAHSSLARLFEDNVDAVFGFLVARSGSPQVAEEVSSDTFAEAARVVAVGRGHEINRPWLFDVARKRLVDHWRRAERHRLRVARLIQLTPNREGAEMTEWPDSDVLDALDTLPTRQRAALVLRYLDGYSVSEVAEALRSSYEAAESLLARGRKSLLAAYERGSQMSYSDEADRVTELLAQIDQTHRPDRAARRDIEQHMWAALDAANEESEDASAVALLGEASRSGPLFGDHPVSPGTEPASAPNARSDKARRVNRVLLMAAAAILLVAAIPLGLRLFDTEPAVTEVASDEPAVRFTATVGGVPLSFTATEPASLGESGSDFVAVRATNAQNPFEASADSVTGQVIIARPTVMFDGQDPETWFAQHELQVEPMVVTHRGERIQAWNVIVPEGSAADRDCDARSPCLAFAQLSGGRTLSLEQGFELNRIRIIPVEDSDQPVVVFSLSGGPRQGPSDDPVTKLSAQVLATIRLGDCPVTC